MWFFGFKRVLEKPVCDTRQLPSDIWTARADLFISSSFLSERQSLYEKWRREAYLGQVLGDVTPRCSQLFDARVGPFPVEEPKPRRAKIDSWPTCRQNFGIDCVIHLFNQCFIRFRNLKNPWNKIINLNCHYKQHLEHKIEMVIIFHQSYRHMDWNANDFFQSTELFIFSGQLKS